MSTALAPHDLDGTDELSLAQQEGLALMAQAEAIKVVDAASFQAAGEFLRSLKAHQRQIADLLDPLIKAAHEAHKVAVAQKKRLLEGPEAAERTLKTAMADYETAQRREALLVQARAAEEAKVATEIARRDGVIAPPVVTPAAPVEVPRAEGVTFTDKWHAEVVDFRALVAAVAAGQVPLDVLAPVQKVLDDHARALKAQLAIPGVRAVAERIARARA